MLKYVKIPANILSPPFEESPTGNRYVSAIFNLFFGAIFFVFFVTFVVFLVLILDFVLCNLKHTHHAVKEDAIGNIIHNTRGETTWVPGRENTSGNRPGCLS